MENNILSHEFDTKSIIKYALPTILMMIFMSTYTIVDGIFVAKLVGEDALSAVNIIVPAFNFVLAVSLMLGTGGVAVIGKLMGEGKNDEAKGFLTTIYILGGALGLLSTIMGYIFNNQIVDLLGANDVLFPYAKDYLLSIIPFAVSMVFQTFVQTFFVTAGKPSLGFTVCVLGGFANIIFDYVLISPKLFNLGIAGAGIATGIGSTVAGVFGVIYFWVKRKEILHFTKPLWNFKMVIQSMYNGSSEMISNLSIAITTIMLNITLMNLAGEAGVAAISVILYIQMFQMAIYAGYSMGVAPIISFKYGEQNHLQLSKIINSSLKFICAMSALVVVLSLLFADFAVAIFISPESSTFALAKEGFMIFSLSYIFMGINIFISAMFTSLSNGKISALLSIGRTFVFIIALILILPRIWGVIGVWLVVPFAELLSALIGLYFYKKHKSVYFY